MTGQFWTAIENGIAELVIESPPVNALDSVGWRRLSEEIDRLNGDDAVHVIVVRAERPDGAWGGLVAAPSFSRLAATLLAP